MLHFFRFRVPVILCVFVLEARAYAMRVQLEFHKIDTIAPACTFDRVGGTRGQGTRDACTSPILHVLLKIKHALRVAQHLSLTK